MKCPLCQNDSRFAFEIYGCRLLDCVKCNHRFAEIKSFENHVENVYGDDYFNGGGAGYSDYAAEGKMLRLRGRNYAKLLKKHVETGRLLDVGAAAGFILQGFLDENWQGIGIEPNAEMAKFGREKLGIEVKNATLENFVTDEQFDLVTIIQVLAHFIEPREAFKKTSELLKPNGFLLIESWNRASFTARIFGKNWHEYSPPSVLHWFSIDGLNDFASGFGFEKIASGKPSKKISGEHAKSLLKYRLGDNFLLKMIPDKINFPYPAEDLFWALYQKKG